MLALIRHDTLTDTVHLSQTAQAGLSLVLVVVLFSWVAATFRTPLPSPLPAYLGTANYTGMASIGSMPISLICASFFTRVFHCMSFPARQVN